MNTIRQEIVSLLSEGEYGAKDISKMLHISEKEVYTHIEHINRSLKPQKMRLKITPAACLTCGFKFEARNRFSSPGRCPKCKGEHIQDPKYFI
ncbi:MAG: ArsR family transcriptional regulator [Deltaproteobacteria bacterium]|nr:ArsR family transcriptional regulator [Deltaproteobacteria bacterium]